jgi:mannonate dehydratase
MGGQAAVERVIDLLGPEGALAYVHFRDVIGTVPSFREGFLGEGNINPGQVLRRLMSAGFDGFIIDDHVPAMIGDATPGSASPTEVYCSRARAHAVGYLQGLLNALEAS